jgi:hypothetical protein
LPVDAGTGLVNKRNPRGRGVGGCFEPGLTRWGPCWSFRRFERVDAAHRSKEGAPFVSVDSKRSYQSSIPQGSRIKINYKGNYLKLTLNCTLSSRASQGILIGAGPCEIRSGVTSPEFLPIYGLTIFG